MWHAYHFDFFLEQQLYTRIQENIHRVLDKKYTLFMVTPHTWLFKNDVKYMVCFQFKKKYFYECK